MIPATHSLNRFAHILLGLVTTCCLLLHPIPGYPATLPPDLSSMIGNQDALLVTDQSGQPVYAKNPDILLVPASVTKLLTALTALHVLGPDFRFCTEFYLDPESNLMIKGYGDPLLTSEGIAEAATELAKRVSHIRHIILDDTYFADPMVIPGATAESVEPYDAPNGSLCVNFNTVSFQKDPVSGRYISAEAQTPLSPFVLPRIRASKLASGRILLTNNHHEAVLYAGHLFDLFFSKAGIKTDGIIRRGTLPTDTVRLIYRHVSPFGMDDTTAKLLFYSNNYIANQLFIAAGAKQFGPPGTLAKGVRAATMYADNVLGIKGLQIEEGSGLSRGNRLSARMLEKILAAFESHRGLMRKENGQYFKTGTLTGVQTRAGYFENKTGRRFRFVIMINSPGKSIRPIMTRLFRILHQDGSAKADSSL